MVRAVAAAVAATALALALALAAGASTSTSTSTAHVLRHGDDRHGADPMPPSDAAAPPLASPTHMHPPSAATLSHGAASSSVASPHADSHELVSVPWIPGGGAGTHDHHAKHNAHAPVLVEFNETNLFLASGPMPLSYIEWDYAYAMGRDEQVARFAQPDVLARPERQMGQVEGIWRTLLDSSRMSDAQRAQTERTIATYVPDDGRIRRHKHLMTLHVVGCVVATLIVCPLALALRAGHSSLAPFACLVYLLLLGGSIVVGQIYNALTPPLYPSNSHGKIGHFLFWLSLAALGRDVVQLIRQIWRAICKALRSQRTGPLSERSNYTAVASEERTAGWRSVLHAALGQGRANCPEKYDVLRNEHERMLQPAATTADLEADQNVAFERVTSIQALSSLEARAHSPHLKGTPASSQCSSPSLAHSVPTLPMNENPIPTSSAWTKLCTTARYVHVVVNRSLPLIGFCCAYAGLAIYTGTCRGRRVNTCAAHGVKGAIFFFYGLLTWARYLGVYAEHGYAWNRIPTLASSRRMGVTRWRRNVISGEFIECMVIFVYGITNTWMERFGSKPGDPYTIKQIQHISIAVMFWFGGLVGLVLEARRMRDLLNFAGVLNHPSAADPSTEQISHRRAVRPSAYSPEGVPARDPADELVNAQVPPPSYSASFNPFPAVIIGLTGSAMAAHHQDYMYEVQIHVLWGNLLAAFGLFRILTYVFLWVRPPTSVLPSRPPTEALAAFCLAGGGLAFMLSSEEVSFAAMRSGYDDVMAILCFLVAVVCLCFCFTALLLLLKNWALRREFLCSKKHRPCTASVEQHHQTQTGPSSPASAADGALSGALFTRCPAPSAIQEVSLGPQSHAEEAVFVLEDSDHA